MNHQQQQFIDQTLPNGNLVLCVVTPKGVANHNVSKENLLTTVATLNAPATHTVYHCMASMLNTVDQYVSKDDPRAIGRTVENVCACRSFIVDLDIKPESYTSQAEAIQALAKVLQQVKLPVPTIVTSGAGLHLYWSLTQDINLQDWQQVASKLIVSLVHAGLKVIDTGLSTNPVVLLRPPGSDHKKQMPHKPVTILKLSTPVDYWTFRQRVDAYHQINQLTTLPSSVSKTSGLPPEELAFARKMGFIPPLEQHDAPAVINGCNQIATCADLPQWRSALSVLRLCVDGRQWAHEVSSKGATYDSAAVDAKLDSMDRYHQEGMPHTCNTFAQLNPQGCEGCLHAGKIKSPIVLGLPYNNVSTVPIVQEELPPVIPPAEDANLIIPAAHVAVEETFQFNDYRFKVTPQGVFHQTTDDDGNSELSVVTENQNFPIGVIADHDTQGNRTYSYMWRIYPKPGSFDYYDYIIPASELHKDKGSISMFADYGVLIEGKKNWETFAMITRAMAAHVRQNKDDVVTRHALGWSQDKQEFVCGAQTVDANYGARRTIPGDNLRSYVATSVKTEPAGSLDKWQAAADVFSRPGLEHGAVGIGVAFGGPLMCFTGQAGALIHFDAETGQGKTAIQNVGSAVWGDPTAMLVRAPGDRMGDTMLSMFSRAAVHNSIPMMLDEITNMRIEDVSSFIHAISLGREKTKMRGSNGGHVFSGGAEWSTLFFSSANASVISKLAQFKFDYAAEAARLLEFRLPPIDPTNAAQDKLILDAVKTNYGHAGLLYARYLIANKDKLPTLVQDKINDINGIIGYRQAERFQIAAMAAIVTGLYISRIAGLHQIDETKIQAWLISHFTTNVRADLKEAKGGGRSPYSDMLHALVGETLVLEGGIDGLPFAPIARPTRGEISVRVELDTQRVYVSSKKVQQWSARNNMVKADILTDIASQELGADRGKVKTVIMSLGRHVREYTGLPSGRCYELILQEDSRTDYRELAVQQTEIES